MEHVCKGIFGSVYRNRGYSGGRAEMIEVSGTGVEAVHDLTEVPDTGMELVTSLLKCRIPVLRNFRTCRSFGNRH